MKVTTDPLAYCRQIPTPIRAILLYGPNTALVKEAIATAKKSLLPKETNEFSLVSFTPADIKANPTALADEFSSYGFFASKKLLHLKDGDDVFVRPLQEAMDLPAAGHFIIIEAGELTPRSALRVWAEKAPDVAAMACYMLEGANLQRFIQAQFQQANAKISNDATLALIDRLGQDLTPLKNIIDQLVTYIGGEQPTATLDHIEALLVDQAEQEMDVLVQAVAESNMPQLDRAIHTLDASGTAMVAILRSLQYYFYRLRSMQVALKNGEDIEALMRRLKIFFKTQPAVKRQLRNWTIPRIDAALAEFTALEAACKKTGTPELIFVHHRLMRLCMPRSNASQR
jgi:DNA polymerase III subunit delta